MPENWSWRTRQLSTCRCVSVMLRADAKYTKELADAKSWKWCSAWWCCRWSSSVAHQQSVSRVKPPPPPAWIMQPPPDWQTPLNGIISPQREADHYAKTTGRNSRSILMSSVDRVAHIDGQLMQLLWAIHTRFQREYKCLKYCNRAIHLRMFAWLALTTFSARYKFCCIDSFLLPNSRNEEMMGDGFLCTLPVCFEIVNVCWVHPVIRKPAQ